MRYRFERHGLLGTVIELTLGGVTRRCENPDPSVGHSGDAMVDDLAHQAFLALTTEIERLQSVFSVFEPDSELSRWRSGRHQSKSPEFNQLMACALEWQQLSRGTFNPLTGRLNELWTAGQETGEIPDDPVLSRTVAEIAEPCFEMIGGAAVAVGPSHGLNLNAMAKGFIVDLALNEVERTLRHSGLIAATVMVNAGGDISHRGSVPARIGVENPFRPYDNEPPLVVIDLDNRAVATSGGSRRGFAIGGTNHSHLLDPRTGLPVSASAAVTVIADDAMTADVAATAAAVMEPGEAVTWIDQLPVATVGPISAMAVAADGVQFTSSQWLGPPTQH